jgi:hypothetical protein
MKPFELPFTSTTNILSMAEIQTVCNLLILR